MTVRGAQQGFTSFLVNFGEWSFLSSIMIVAVAVPVNPTSSPAISWASMISSYLGFSSVYEAKTQQRGRHLDWSHCSGQVAGLCSASAVCPLCQGRHLRRPALSPVVDKHTFGVSPSRTVLIHGLELAVGMESIFCPCLRGHVIHSIMFQVQGLGTYWTFDVYIHHMSFHSGLMELIQNEAKSDDEIRTKITALGTEQSGPGIRSLCFSETSISLFNQHVKLHLLFPLYRWENTNWGLESFILHFLHATVSCFSLLYHVKFERCFLIQSWSDKFNTKAILHCYPSIYMYFIWIFDRYFAIMFKHSQLIQGSVGRWVWSAPIGRMPEIWDYADWNSPLDSVTHPGVYSGGSSWHWSQPESIFGLLAVKGNCGENSFTVYPILFLFDCGAASQEMLVVKNLAANAGDVRHSGSIPESERSSGEGNGDTHSSILAWRIPRTDKPGGLWSTGSRWARQDQRDLARTHSWTLQTMWPILANGMWAEVMD